MAIQLSITLVAVTFIAINLLEIFGDALVYVLPPLAWSVKVLMKFLHTLFGISILTASIGVSVPLT